MPKQPKTPREKKQLEYTKDHFTFGRQSSRNFPKVWKQKKTNLNHEFRSKSDQLLSRVKKGTNAGEAETAADDLTAARFERSLVRKRLQKAGTVPVGEKIRLKLERRTQSVGRRTKRNREVDARAIASIAALQQLVGSKLKAAAWSAYLLLALKDERELARIMRSKHATDKALFFVRQSRFSGYECDAMRRSPELRAELKKWIEKANRLVRSDARRLQQKIQNERASKMNNRGGRDRGSERSE